MIRLELGNRSLKAHLRRRAALAGIAAFALPAVSVRAQAPLRLGWLSISPHPFIADFRDRLKQLGYVEGENLVIEYRYAEGDPARLPELVQQLVQKGVAILVPSGSAATDAAVAGASGIPVVFVTSDPSITGRIASIARPGGIATGISTLAEDVGSKKIDLMRDALGTLSRLAIWTDESPGGGRQVESMVASARGLGIETRVQSLVEPASFDRNLSDLAAARWQAAIAVSSPLFTAHAGLLGGLTVRHRLPAMFDTPAFVQAGALMSYGADLPAVFRRLAELVQRVARGAMLSDIPVERPTRLMLAFNQTTARALGLTPSLPLQASIDDLVE